MVTNFVQDLPVLAIDSFRHMYVFPDVKEMKYVTDADMDLSLFESLSVLFPCSVPGKIYQFITDLHSGKLHKDFHNPTPVSVKTLNVCSYIQTLLSGSLGARRHL